MALENPRATKKTSLRLLLGNVGKCGDAGSKTPKDKQTLLDELKQLSSKKKNANENIEGLGDIDVSKLNKLSKSQIKKLGGESFTQELKTNVGKSKSDLFVDKTTGDIFSIGKKGTPPQFVGNIDVTFFD